MSADHSPDKPPQFNTANPHALATILEASQTKSIIASRDIFDLSGIKLWARDQPVSSELQRKLLDRQLRNPLESCLLAEDGVTVVQLVQQAETLLGADTPLADWLRPHAARLVQETRHLPLHPVAQLLLTAGEASRPESFRHSLQAMLLAGALMLEHGGSTSELRLAMLAGLLHDLGEIYVDPRYGEADADRTLDLTSYQQLVVHPHIGRLIIAQLTNYPGVLARAVAEHHERMDGTGYPHGLQREALSPLGRLLAVTEAALAVLRGEHPQLARVSVALRVVPGEYDLGWVGHISAAIGRRPLPDGAPDRSAVQARLGRLDAAMQTARETLDRLLPLAETTPFKDTLGLTQHLLQRLRTGWYASGLWTTEALAPQDVAEVDAVEDELRFRLRSIERAAQLRAGGLPEGDAERLIELRTALRGAPVV